MTKKHFEAIAAAIAQANMLYGATQYGEQAPPRTVLETVANNLATICAAENPNFDRARFLRACGV